MRIAYIEGEFIKPTVVKKPTLTDRALALAESQKRNHKKNALRKLKKAS